MSRPTQSSIEEADVISTQDSVRYSRQDDLVERTQRMRSSDDEDRAAASDPGDEGNTSNLWFDCCKLCVEMASSEDARSEDTEEEECSCFPLLCCLLKCCIL